MQSIPKPRFTRIDGIAIALALGASVACVNVLSEKEYFFLIVPAIFVWIGLVGQFFRRMQIITRIFCIAAGVVSLACFANLHSQRMESEQAKADAIVLLIQKFHTQHQRYPKTLDEVGITKSELTERLDRRAHYYLFQSEEPVFRRSSTVPFEYYSYDFKTKKWIYQPD